MSITLMYKNGKKISIIDHNVNCVEAILTDLRHRHPLTSEEEYDLWLRMRQGDQRAYNRLVESNMPYAMRIAKLYIPSGAALEDLYQAGCEGLVKAAAKFDASLGYRFISYATWFVENEVRNTAYDHIDHNLISLDEPLDDDDADGTTQLDLLSGSINQSADWGIRYNDALAHLMSRVDKRMFGAGRLVGELHKMLLQGYATVDFARRHRLNEHQMIRLLAILREEAGFPRAA